MPLTMTCARPSCSTMSGVAHVSISSRLARHSSWPVALVERDDERRARHEVIPDDDEVVAVERRRGSLAELVAHPLVAEVLLPDERPVHVVGVEAERVERRDDVLAVGDRRARRPRAVVRMRRFVRHRLVRGPFPDRLAGAPVDRHHDEAVRRARRDRAARRVASPRRRRRPAPRSARTAGRPRRPATTSRGPGSRPSSGCSSSRSTRAADCRAPPRRWRAGRATAASISRLPDWRPQSA